MWITEYLSSKGVVELNEINKTRETCSTGPARASSWQLLLHHGVSGPKELGSRAGGAQLGPRPGGLPRPRGAAARRMTPCNVLVVAAAVARALPGAAASCQAPRSRLRCRIPRCRPPCWCGSWGSAARALPDPAPTHRTMRAVPPPAQLLPLLLLALLAAPAARANRAESISAPRPEPERESRPPPGPGPGNTTRIGFGAAGGSGSSNSSGDALVTRISTLLRDLPTLKAAVIVAFAFTTLLIACLLLRVFRSGKRLKKTRKYDIITTPAERVEMAPLNEEDDEDEDSTVFDIKYRGVGLATEQPWLLYLSSPRCTQA
uniref:Family with sequence similarity 174 member B n=6 Tax=Cercopithecinae TaxID=9528 RepID=A0A8I5ND24_PAPAN